MGIDQIRIGSTVRKPEKLFLLAGEVG